MKLFKNLFSERAWRKKKDNLGQTYSNDVLFTVFMTKKVLFIGKTFLIMAWWGYVVQALGINLILNISTLPCCLEEEGWATQSSSRILRVFIFKDVWKIGWKKKTKRLVMVYLKWIIYHILAHILCFFYSVYACFDTRWGWFLGECWRWPWLTRGRRQNCVKCKIFTSLSLYLLSCLVHTCCSKLSSAWRRIEHLIPVRSSTRPLPVDRGGCPVCKWNVLDIVHRNLRIIEGIT